MPKNKPINCSFSIESNHPPTLHLPHGSSFHLIKEKKFESKMRMYSPIVEAAPIIKPRFLRIYQRILLDSTSEMVQKIKIKNTGATICPKGNSAGIHSDARRVGHIQGCLAKFRLSNVAWHGMPEDLSWGR